MSTELLSRKTHHRITKGPRNKCRRKLTSTGTEENPTRSLRICLVEDHVETLAALTRLLEHKGHRVVGAQSMREAIEILGAFAFDLLISDIMLEDGTGWELLERLGDAKPHVAIAISGCGIGHDYEISKLVGFREHLMKPIAYGALENILAEVAEELDAV